MVRLYRRPLRLLCRYTFNTGAYPISVKVRTPLGPILPTLHSPHDLLTLNEVFCRMDYAASSSTRTVVDIGSNIGISALYFLTRSPRVVCHLFEPVPANVERLRANLAGFEDRYHLHQVAVTKFTGSTGFSVEPTGRYGGVDMPWPDRISVPCISINDALRSVLDGGADIDILKIDVEGLEVPLVEAIDPDVRARIRRIYIEAAPDSPVLPQWFDERIRGPIRILTARDNE